MVNRALDNSMWPDDPNQFEFDVENSPQPRVQAPLEEEESSSLNTSNASNTDSQQSTRVIEFDESDQIIEKKKSKKNLQLEMVNLRELREFKPEGTVNQSKKKREKRLAKKNKAKEEAIQEEAKKKAKRDAELREEVKKGNKEGKFLNAVGKVLKKKTVPKKKVVDENGSEWEVVDERKAVIVEETDSEKGRDTSDSEDEIAFA